MLYQSPWIQFYSYGLYLASPVLTGFMIYTEYWLAVHHIDALAAIGVLIVIRIAQSVSLLIPLIVRSLPLSPYAICLVISGLPTLLIDLTTFPMKKPPPILVVCLSTHTLLSILEWMCALSFLDYRCELAVEAQLKSSLCRHTISVGGTPDEDIGIKLRWLSSLCKGSIALSGDKSPLSSVPRALSAPVSHGVLHWARLLRDPGTRKVLWITDDQHKIDACASGVFHLLSAARATLSVDVSDTGRIIPLLVYALWTLWPKYREQLIDDGGLWPTYIYKGDMDVSDLVNQLKKMNENYLKEIKRDSKSQSPKKPPSITVIIHGIHDSGQATEIYAIIRSLRDQHPLDIVAITTPELLHQVSRDHYSIMRHIYTLAVSAMGMVSCSADPSALRWFNQNLFLLVLDANFRFPRMFDERLWADLCDRAARVCERRDDDIRSNHEIVALLYDAVEDRKKILQFLSDVPAITQDKININIDKDNTEIAPLLQQLLESRWLNQNLFLLVLNANFRFPRMVDERLWADLCDRAARVCERRDDVIRSTHEIVALLYNTVEDREKILQFLSDVPAITEDEININVDKDNTEIALLLQQLLENRSYKHEITEITEVEALSVLNLTHQILERGLPEHTEIKNKKLLKHRAQRLVNVLADFLQILPEKLAVHGVILLNDRPVQYGGFADIYHGQYTNSEGEEVQVALKVLKVFQDQFDPTRHLILRKFAKEALIWHYLRHPNIVPFIGVDATTFPTPMMAMVSSWMSQGSVLQYMRKNSPMSRYAITLLNDIIQGLMYLHSENILHGDLCGRNILIKERRACLTDFGLAAFIQSDTSIKTSTRSGSTRWMAPELLLPTVYDEGHSCKQTSASDVWAFGCVCCEIWTEGQIPFAHMSDGGLILALSKADPSEAIPYPTRPCDKAGIVMPEKLWELVRRCFALHAVERPTVHVIAAMLDEIQLGEPTGAESSNILTASEVALRASGVDFSPPQSGSPNASPTELTRTIQLLVEDVRDQPANKFIQELCLPCVGDLPTGEWLVNGHDLLKALQESPSSLNGAVKLAFDDPMNAGWKRYFVKISGSECLADARTSPVQLRVSADSCLKIIVEDSGAAAA